MEDVGILYNHLVFLWPFGIYSKLFGIFYGYLVYFSRFGMLYQEKSGNPGLQVFRLPGKRIVHRYVYKYVVALLMLTK
jgi:hypothetical protein